MQPKAARILLVCKTNSVSFIATRKMMVSWSNAKHVGWPFLPYFPLASGLLTGKYRHGKKVPEGSRAAEGWGPKVFTEKNLAIVERLIEFAESRNHTVLDLAFAWLLAHKPVASVTAGASKPEQIQANAKAVNWKLTSDDLAQIDAIMTAR